MKNIQSHSIELQISAVEDANNYNVTFTRTMGDRQLGICSGSHTVSVYTSNLSVIVGNETLKAYTTYSVTVIAMSNVWGCSEDSKPIIFTTSQKSEDQYSTFSA